MATVLDDTEVSKNFVQAGATKVFGLSEGIDEEADWNLRVALAPPVKDSMTRLLDMLSGWAEKAVSDEFPDSEAALERIADLYQEAGQFAFDDATAEEKQRRIQSFLIERVLPTLTL